MNAMVKLVNARRSNSSASRDPRGQYTREELWARDDLDVLDRDLCRNLDRSPARDFPETPPRGTSPP